MKGTKYGITSLRKQFPHDKACLEFIFDVQHSRACHCGGTYRLMANSRKFQCSKCRFKISPTAHTIFNKSDTPLTSWFHAIMVFSNAKSGMSAKALERDLEVTYKTAWRILHLIRKALAQSKDKLQGDVEMDLGYFGGHHPGGKYNIDQSEAIKAKSIVMAAIERGGEARAKIVKDSKADTHGKFLRANIEVAGTRLLTDKTNRLQRVAKHYDRQTVDHSRKEYVRGDVHVNNVEYFWSHIKRSIKGTHKVVSKQHLQSYLDGFVFHYNNRYNDRDRFFFLLGRILHAAR